MAQPCESLTRREEFVQIGFDTIEVNSQTTVPDLLRQGLEPGTRQLGLLLMTAAQLHREKADLCATCPLKQAMPPGKVRRAWEISNEAANHSVRPSQVFVDVLNNKALEIARKRGFPVEPGAEAIALADCAHRRAVAKRSQLRINGRKVRSVSTGSYL